MSEANDPVPKAAANPDTPFHYFLVTGQAVFLRDGSKAVEALVSNTLMITHDHKVRARDIGRVQQGIQMNLHKKMTDQETKPVKVIDVVIMSIAYLGEMSQREFEANSMLETVRANQEKEGAPIQ
jgi:hypothetical protein